MISKYLEELTTEEYTALLAEPPQCRTTAHQRYLQKTIVYDLVDLFNALENVY